jgi:hypothetical protein
MAGLPEARPSDAAPAAAPRAALNTLIALSEDAYPGDPDHSPLANLRCLLAGTDRWPYDPPPDPP